MRGQSNTLDLLLAILLITAGIILIATFGLPDTNEPAVYDQAQSAAEALFSPYPTNWTDETVIVPGIVEEHRLREDLFTQAQSLDNIEAIIGIDANLFVNTTLGTIGDQPPSDAAYITRLMRYAAYNATITEVEVIVWQE